jgi:hypothetical protein
MKATIEFNLPEDRYEHKTAMRGGDYLSAISEFTQKVRDNAKYLETTPKDWQEVKDLWWSILEDHEINPYEE